MIYRYAMTQRPGGPGAQPKSGLKDIIDPENMPEITKKYDRVYSIVTYDRKLTDKEIQDYELTPIVNFHEMAEEMYNGSWYTITGVADPEEYKHGYQDMMEEQDIGEISRWFMFYGSEMNKEYGLTGDNRYRDDLVFLAFPLEGLDIKKLAFFKIEMRDRWFDDIVDNNASRQRMIDREVC